MPGPAGTVPRSLNQEESSDIPSTKIAAVAQDFLQKFLQLPHTADAGDFSHSLEESDASQGEMRKRIEADDPDDRNSPSSEISDDSQCENSKCNDLMIGKNSTSVPLMLQGPANDFPADLTEANACCQLTSHAHSRDIATTRVIASCMAR